MNDYNQNKQVNYKIYVYKSPLAAAIWSICLHGFGQFYVRDYIMGFVLVLGFFTGLFVGMFLGLFWRFLISPVFSGFALGLMRKKLLPIDITEQFSLEYLPLNLRTDLQINTIRITSLTLGSSKLNLYGSYSVFIPLPR